MLLVVAATGANHADAIHWGRPLDLARHRGRKLAVRDNSIVVVNSAKRAGESSRVWMLRGTLGS